MYSIRVREQTWSDSCSTVWYIFKLVCIYSYLCVYYDHAAAVLAIVLIMMYRSLQIQSATIWELVTLQSIICELGRYLCNDFWGVLI